MIDAVSNAFAWYGATTKMSRDLEEMYYPKEPEEVVEESPTTIVTEVSEDNSRFMSGVSVTSITEEGIYASPADIRKVLDTNELDMRKLIDSMKQEYSVAETYKENEEMSKDAIVGSAMELMTDDSCMRHPVTKKIISIESEDAGLAEFLNTFLIENVKIDKRIWTWGYEIVKHGDLKLRRREYVTENKVKGVYYEDIMEGWKVSRIEYLGEVLGYLDEDEGKGNKLESPDAIIHFLSTKLSRKKKVKVKISKKGMDNINEAEDINKDGQPMNKDDYYMDEISCYKVSGTCLVDNARYIFRVVKLLDDMLLMARITRATQFNIVKVEVGNAGSAQTQNIIMDIRRRIEGNTKMGKGKGMKSDASPIPVNSNVYVPVREGKGDINIESVGDNVDVKAITDIDYFRNKEFATVKTPKAFLGFEEELPGSMGVTSLTKLDARYARTVQRVQNIIKEGVRELCNNYLAYRGKTDDQNKFHVAMRDVTSAEDAAVVEDVLARLQTLDTFTPLYETYGDFLDKGKVLLYLATMVGLDITNIGNEELIKLMYAKKEEEEKKAEASKANKFGKKAGLNG